MYPTPEAAKDMLESASRMSRDIREATRTMTEQEARFLVDAYYTMQKNRIRARNQIKAMTGEPNAVLQWLASNNELLEKQLKGALQRYALGHPTGQWLMSVLGIGPVIAAGLMAHIDITQADTAGKIWRYAGLDPTSVWKKGEKRPWNGRLKVVCFHAGESFVKVSSNENDVYGKVWRKRKDLEVERNEAGEFAEQAAAKLERFNIGKSTDAYGYYSQGQLPPAHIHARAKRYAVKLFLSHTQEAMFVDFFRRLPPKPYILTDPRHVHYKRPPNMHHIEGWRELRAEVGDVVDEPLT